MDNNNSDDLCIKTDILVAKNCQQSSCQRVAEHVSRLMDAVMIFKTWLIQHHQQQQQNFTANADNNHWAKRAECAEETLMRVQSACAPMQRQVDAGLRYKMEVHRLKSELQMAKDTMEHYRNVIKEGKDFREDLRSELDRARKSANSARAMLDSEKRRTVDVSASRNFPSGMEDGHLSSIIQHDYEQQKLSEENTRLRETIIELTKHEVELSSRLNKIKAHVDNRVEKLEIGSNEIPIIWFQDLVPLVGSSWIPPSPFKTPEVKKTKRGRETTKKRKKEVPENIKSPSFALKSVLDGLSGVYPENEIERLPIKLTSPISRSNRYASSSDDNSMAGRNKRVRHSRKKKLISVPKKTETAAASPVFSVLQQLSSRLSDDSCDDSNDGGESKRQRITQKMPPFSQSGDSLTKTISQLPVIHNRTELSSDAISSDEERQEEEEEFVNLDSSMASSASYWEGVVRTPRRRNNSMESVKSCISNFAAVVLEPLDRVQLQQHLPGPAMDKMASSYDLRRISSTATNKATSSAILLSTPRRSCRRQVLSASRQPSSLKSGAVALRTVGSVDLDAQSTSTPLKTNTRAISNVPQVDVAIVIEDDEDGIANDSILRPDVKEPTSKRQNVAPAKNTLIPKRPRTNANVVKGIPGGRIQTRPSVNRRLLKSEVEQNSLLGFVVSRYSQAVADWFSELTELAISNETAELIAPVEHLRLTVVGSKSLAATPVRVNEHYNSIEEGHLLNSDIQIIQNSKNTPSVSSENNRRSKRLENNSGNNKNGIDGCNDFRLSGMKTIETCDASPMAHPIPAVKNLFSTSKMETNVIKSHHSITVNSDSDSKPLQLKTDPKYIDNVTIHSSSRKDLDSPDIVPKTVSPSLISIVEDHQPVAPCKQVNTSMINHTPEFTMNSSASVPSNSLLEQRLPTSRSIEKVVSKLAATCDQMLLPRLASLESPHRYVPSLVGTSDNAAEPSMLEMKLNKVISDIVLSHPNSTEESSLRSEFIQESASKSSTTEISVWNSLCGNTSPRHCTIYNNSFKDTPRSICIQNMGLQLSKSRMLPNKTEKSNPNTFTECPVEDLTKSTGILNITTDHPPLKQSVPMGSSSVLDANVRPFILDDVILPLLSANEPAAIPGRLRNALPDRITQSVFTNLSRLFVKTSDYTMTHLYCLPLTPTEKRAIDLLRSLQAFRPTYFLFWLRQRRRNDLSVVQLYRLIRTALALMATIESRTILIYELAVVLASPYWSMKPRLPVSCLVLASELSQTPDTSSLVLTTLRHLIALEMAEETAMLTPAYRIVRQGLKAANWITAQRSETKSELGKVLRKFVLNLVDNILEHPPVSDEALLAFRLIIIATAFKDVTDEKDQKNNINNSRKNMLKRRQSRSPRFGTLGWLLYGRLLPTLTNLIKEPEKNIQDQQALQVLCTDLILLGAHLDGLRSTSSPKKASKRKLLPSHVNTNHVQLGLQRCLERLLELMEHETYGVPFCLFRLLPTAPERIMNIFEARQDLASPSAEWLLACWDSNHPPSYTSLRTPRPLDLIKGVLTNSGLFHLPDGCRIKQFLDSLRALI